MSLSQSLRQSEEVSVGTYVVGDIHGCFDEWMLLKEHIEKEDKNAMFILTGDIVDRGPKVVEMLKWAASNVKPGGRYQMVVGDHELEKIKWWKSFCVHAKGKSAEEMEAAWKEFYSDKYTYQQDLINGNATVSLIDRFTQFMESLPIEIHVNIDHLGVQKHFVVVHSVYLPELAIRTTNRYVKSYEIQDIKAAASIDRYFGAYADNLGVIVVHGHTPTVLYHKLNETPTEVGRVDYRKNNINVDCGMVYRKPESHLAALRLEDFIEFYVKYNVEVRHGNILSV